MVTRPSPDAGYDASTRFTMTAISALPIALYKEVMRLRKGEQAIFELFHRLGLGRPMQRFAHHCHDDSERVLHAMRQLADQRDWCESQALVADVLKDRHKPGRPGWFARSGKERPSKGPQPLVLAFAPS